MYNYQCSCEKASSFFKMYAASKKNNITAKIATKSSPCAFCGREVDDEAKYGRLYEIGDISCHYFCVLLSCCLIQKGKDEDGLFGFLYVDILTEIARSKKHKCSFCGYDGANLGCSVSQCKKQFHLPCGRERNAVSMFYGNFKSFCAKHAPKQKISDTVMERVKERMAKKRLQNLSKAPNKTVTECGISDDPELACVICYEAVEGYPSIETFWPPCCGRDAWFHRSCLERMCLSAGVHYLKCPLCNDKEKFREVVLQQGYYIPDRDAAWELEQNAFSEIYNTSYSCGVETCLCPNGRSHDSESGPWDINLCVLCGSAGAHARCRAAVDADAEQEAKPYVCPTCITSAQSAPNLIRALHELALQEQSAAQSERVLRPLMPSRMSLRRTKCRPATISNIANNIEAKREVNNTEMSRLELNLKTPKRSLPEPEVIKVENTLLSLIKQLGLYERISYELDVDTIQLNSDEVVARIRQKLMVPQPLTVKRKIVIAILEDLMNTSSYKDKFKMKEPVREWISPKKYVDIEQEEDKMPPIEPTKDDLEAEMPYTAKTLSSDTQIYGNALESPKLKTVQIETDSSMEISEDNNMVNIDVVTREESKKTVSSPLKISSLKLSPNNKHQSNKLNVDIDIESFQVQYLSETSQTNNRKRKLSDADTKIELEKCKKHAKRRRHNKGKNRKYDNEKKRIKIKLQFQKHSRDADERIVAMKDKKLRKERSKINKKKNKGKIKIKLKFKKQNFEIKNRGISLKENKKTKKSKIHEITDEENVKIKLNINEQSFGLDNKRTSFKKDKKLKKGKCNLHKDKKKEKEDKITESKSNERRDELKESPKVLKQYILEYTQDKNKTTIVKPQTEITLKRKRKRNAKKEKSADNFKQMSLDNFFSPNLSPKYGKH